VQEEKCRGAGRNYPCFEWDVQTPKVSMGFFLFA